MTDPKPVHKAASGEARIPGGFDRIAGHYGAGEYHRRRRDAVLLALNEEFGRARQVLDLGCGNGSFTTELAKMANVRRLVGADRAQAMLEETRARTVPAPLLVRNDMCWLPFRPATFDLVLCSHVLIFASDLARAVSDIARVLQPGGTLIATLSPRGGLRSDLRGMMPAAQWQHFEPLVFGAMTMEGEDAVDHERYRKLYAAAGLEAIAVTVSFEIEFAHVEEWLNGQWLRREEGADRAAALAEIARLREQIPAVLDLQEPLLIGRRPS